MKQLMILMLGLIVSTSSFANTTSGTSEPASLSSTISVKEAKKFDLLVGKTDATASIALKDSDGMVIYKNKASLAKGYRQSFDVTQLAPGKYTFEIKTGEATITKVLLIQS